MNVAHAPVANPPLGVSIAEHPSALKSLLKPGCAGAIWRRQVPQPMLDWLQSLAPDALPRGRVITKQEQITATVDQLIDQSSLPTGPQRDWLRSDIIALTQMFADLLGCTRLRLRLDVVTNNACRKFHIDAITARLVCTYRGTGTQYGISTNETDPDWIFTVQTGAPMLLRGTLWPEQPRSGLRHRSPPIEGTGETRLLLVVDPVADPSERA